jgi:hypothetical protein
MSSASAEAVEEHLDGRMTIVARSVAVAVDRFATWKVNCM